MQGARQPMRIYCRADTNLNMAARGNRVLLVPANLNDESQQWIQDYDCVGRVTDDQGRRAFALVNVGTQQAVFPSRHGELEMAPFGDCVKITMLWSLGVQLADGYNEVRVLRDISVSLNGFGRYIREGTVVGIHGSEAHKDNAVWKFDPI
uniref:Uncharacterized protein n=1 Tax=Leersia perrieri TaxID=77586 RepID=A0A0D9XXJ8_9ORYZ